MTFDEFIKKYLGKKVDWDGVYGGQCVDLFRQYVNDVLDFPQPNPVSGARLLWEGFDLDPNLYTYYDKIPNSPYGIPKKGDVLVWNAKMGGGYGHVAMFIEGGLMSFKSFDQNFPTLDKCTITEHNYSNLYGWLRPKILIEPCVELEKENKSLKEALEKSKDHEKFWFDALKLVGLPEDSKWKKFKSTVVKLYEDKQKAEKKIKELEKMIAENVTGLDAKKNNKYVYDNTSLILEILRRIKGGDSK